MPFRARLALLVLSSFACDRSADSIPPTCGLAALAAASTLLEQFTIPNQTMVDPPATLPERTVVRIAADGAFPAVVGRTDSMLVVGVEGNPPAGTKPGFGVLVTDPQERVMGVMLFEGTPIPGAPTLGSVSVGSGSIPLIGIQVDQARITDPKCPALFPDSLLR